MYLPRTRGARHQYAVIVVDGYSRFVFLRPLKTKSGKEVREALVDIIEKNDLYKAQTFSSDLGTEFVSNASYFKEKYGIIWFWLKSKTKAFLVENTIKSFKGLLYRYMRLHPKKIWTDFEKDIVNQLNIRPLKALKNYAPIDFVDPVSDARSRSLLSSKETDFRRKRVKKPEFKKNDLVFVEIPASEIQRGFDLQRGAINKVAKVDTHSYPYLYELEDLEGKKISRKFYAIELKRAFKLRNLPKQIKHIYGSRRKNYKREYQVTFVGNKYVFFCLFYMNYLIILLFSYKTWIPERLLYKF